MSTGVGMERESAECVGQPKKISPVRVKAMQITKGVSVLDEFMSKEVAEHDIYMTPWLRSGSLSMIFAARGVGKTWFCLSMLIAITRGMPFGAWATENSVDCLYVDGEMSAYDLQDRLRGLTAGLPEKKSNLYVLSCDIMRMENGTSINLSDETWREALYCHLRETEIKVVCLDNISSLTPGIDENDKASWDAVNQWLLRLRAMGVAVVLVHHSGKDKAQRGTSGREDNLDYTIQLTSPQNHKVQDGARFQVAFTKARGICGPSAEPFTITIEQVDGHTAWTTSVNEADKRIAVVSLLGSGTPQKYVSERAGCAKSLVTRYKKEAIEAGFLNEDGTFTKAGRKRYEGAIFINLEA